MGVSGRVSETARIIGGLSTFSPSETMGESNNITDTHAGLFFLNLFVFTSSQSQRSLPLIAYILDALFPSLYGIYAQIL